MSEHSYSARTLALRVLAPFGAGYFMSYVYRSVNAILAPEISRAINLDAATLGLMTGMYFLTFGAVQLPLGILLDRYGPRRVEAALLLFAAAGAATFATADTAGALIFGRALVGMGVSACLMGALKANVQFFPPTRLSLMNGIILGAGGLGAVAATAPVQAALAFTDWRGVYLILAGLTVAAAALLFRVVPDCPAHPQSGGLAGQLRDIGGIFRTPMFLRVFPLGMLTMGSFLAIQGLWAGPWLRDVAGLDVAGVAQGLTVQAVAVAVGFLSWGVIADRLARFHVPVASVAAVGQGVFILAALAMAIGWTGAPLLVVAAFGFFGASSSLMYAVVTLGFPVHLAGRATTSLNLTMFAAAFLFQWGIGAIIGLWPKGPGGWPVEAYSWALAVPVVLLVLGFVWFIPVARTEKPR